MCRHRPTTQIRLYLLMVITQILKLRDLYQKHCVRVRVQVGEMEFETERKKQGNVAFAILQEGRKQSRVWKLLEVASAVAQPALWLRFWKLLERQRQGWQTVGDSASSLVPGMLDAAGTEIWQHIGWGSLHLLTTPLHTPHTAGSAFQVQQQNPF